MNVPAPALSPDQAEAWDRIAATLDEAGIDLEQGYAMEGDPDEHRVLAVTGKAGSGKTLLLAQMVKEMREAGLKMVTGDYQPKGGRTLAVLAPTNKAASVLRSRGVPATTIHRILYTPVYDPQYEKIAEWLAGERDRPTVEGLTDEQLDRAKVAFDETQSIPGAMAAAGLKGSDFISGWKRRDAELDVGFVDESSMLDDQQYEDLAEIFPTLVLFGDPAQLAPVNQSGRMVFERLPAPDVLHLDRVHRQEADSPILDLAHALSDDRVDFYAFERMVEEAAAADPRVVMATRADPDLMARSPMLVWRNKTRVRLIRAFRQAHGIGEHEMMPGEPLLCDGLELPLKQRKRRVELEARGLIKGAQVIYLGPGKKPGFCRIHVVGAPDPQVSVASIVKIEVPDVEEPHLPFAAKMGAAFLHGAACTIHKAQGSQWEDVQVFAPDLFAAFKVGRSEAGQPLWKRLAYVAITRAQSRLIWVRRAALALPQRTLGTDDLVAPAPQLTLEGEPPE
ncbi:AAA family ATPase [Jannaschia sp. Os4]|uniref:ATP-dependent DNA helicase n=1 Tax=Jannaschia sp. Os4 TaxID=2807617 RepID=UPI00193A472A|nr:AAA family ATPase [Jannaschia sp. Os4]MBM2575781.1 AAA family ATPase [Jannaschia sp. Os4]